MKSRDIKDRLSAIFKKAGLKDDKIPDFGPDDDGEAFFVLQRPYALPNPFTLH
ncbi:hypothetical protein [Paraburkholderia sp. UCT31]|uniref:hypothetical protein n=1 Tax=Paraburkholderia sp. UCT31 TaxID=2615209 RepID=UPI0016564815|nr:hypothetical protein [Paraburkholderia sp. UCT31]